MNMKKILALSLAVVMALSFAGCGSSSGNSAPPTDTETTETSEEETTTQADTVENNFSDAEIGGVVTFGTYEQDNDTSNGEEPIEWIVLDKEDDKVLLISKYILDSQPYNEGDTDVTWETCTLRKWLNEDFINDAFTNSEQNDIVLSYVENPSYGTGADSGNDTEDKMFVLSMSELETYFDRDEGCIAETTNYSMEKSVQAYMDYWDKSESEARESAEAEKNIWWLRTSGSANNYAMFVYSNGNAKYFESLVGDGTHGVRPAMWVETATTESTETVDSEPAQQTTYTADELCELAKQYYYNQTGYMPGHADASFDKIDGEEVVVIQLYDVTGGHTATSDWYTVNYYGVGTDLLGNSIDISQNQ